MEKWAEFVDLAVLMIGWRCERAVDVFGVGAVVPSPSKRERGRERERENKRKRVKTTRPLTSRVRSTSTKQVRLSRAPHTHKQSQNQITPPAHLSPHPPTGRVEMDGSPLSHAFLCQCPAEVGGWASKSTSGRQTSQRRGCLLLALCHLRRGRIM